MSFVPTSGLPHYSTVTLAVSLKEKLRCLHISDTHLLFSDGRDCQAKYDVALRRWGEYVYTNVGRNGWIPSNELLPEGRQDVLVCFDNIDGCIIAWYAPNGRTWRNSSTDNICKAEPIAWMNLPSTT